MAVGGNRKDGDRRPSSEKISFTPGQGSFRLLKPVCEGMGKVPKNPIFLLHPQDFFRRKAGEIETVDRRLAKPPGSDVVEQNVQISQDTKQVSSDMADITGKLLKMVHA